MVVWDYTAVDGAYAATIRGGRTAVSYTPEAPFTPFESLTESQVAGWVLGAWSPSLLALYQQQLVDQIERMKTEPYFEARLPWAG